MENDYFQFKNLQKKMDCLKSDKQKLLLIINEMDAQKRDILDLAYKQVTKDFGSIFKMLLPGADAKLEALQESDMLKGLEVSNKQLKMIKCKRCN